MSDTVSVLPAKTLNDFKQALIAIVTFGAIALAIFGYVRKWPKAAVAECLLLRRC